MRVGKVRREIDGLDGGATVTQHHRRNLLGCTQAELIFMLEKSADRIRSLEDTEEKLRNEIIEQRDSIRSYKRDLHGVMEIMCDLMRQGERLVFRHEKGSAIRTQMAMAMVRLFGEAIFIGRYLEEDNAKAWYNIMFDRCKASFWRLCRVSCYLPRSFTDEQAYRMFENGKPEEQDEILEEVFGDLEEMQEEKNYLTWLEPPIIFEEEPEDIWSGKANMQNDRTYRVLADDL